ncbi:MAG: GNAT family N-acetyltransferase [bacterium]|nr:GNAT family N-acetyltransferase [bacterium]
MKQPFQFTIRKARENDHKEVNALYLEWQKYHHKLLPKLLKNPASKTHIKRGTFINLIKDHDTTAIVAVVDERVVGLIEVVFDTIDADTEYYKLKRASIDYLYVLPKYRRHGIGRALVEAGAEWARSKKRTVLSVVVYESNQEAFKLYCKTKFDSYSIRLNREL